jgi:predicted esterase
VDAHDPHAGQPMLSAGPAVGEAAGVLVMLHGRGGTARDILALHGLLNVPGVAAVAPQAHGNTWYPHSFLAPVETNQPMLDSALRRVESAVAGLLDQRIDSRLVAILGFSQGACLACEFVARHPRRYGALIALTGGLIGPPGTSRDYAGSLDGTPVMLGTSDPDPHVPLERVRETATVLTRMGASVDLRVYSGMPHTINDDEIAAARSLLQRIAAGAGAIGGRGQP